jgi:hypothetical protein
MKAIWKILDLSKVWEIYRWWPTYVGYMFNLLSVNFLFEIHS